MSAPGRISAFSATELGRHLRSGELRAVEIVRDCLAQIERGASLKSWVTLGPERALAAAQVVDEALAAKKPVRALAGIPVGVKDIFNTADLPTSMGSPIWTGFTPGNDARVVFNLRQAGGIVVGKTVTAEFAVHQLGETMHPHDATRNPGTSSTGSAVAVAAHHVPIALGTQTAGSIIRPASYCGIYGFKPSFGLLPRTGMLKTTDSLDTVGYFARTVDDLRLVFDIVRVTGLDYPISNAALTDAARQTKPASRPWRLAFVRPHTWSESHGYARALLEKELDRWRKSAGVEIVEKELPPSVTEAHDVHSVIYDKTLSYYFKEEQKQAKLVSPIFQQLMAHGATITGEQYRAALERQQEIADDIDGFFGDVDALVTLSVAGEAPLRDETERRDSCLIWTLAGLPVVNVPAMVGPSGLPVGVQVVARRYNDLLLLGLLDHLVASGVAPRAPNPAPRPL